MAYFQELSSENDVPKGSSANIIKMRKCILFYINFGKVTYYY